MRIMSTIYVLTDIGNKYYNANNIRIIANKCSSHLPRLRHAEENLSLKVQLA